MNCLRTWIAAQKRADTVEDWESLDKLVSPQVVRDFNSLTDIKDASMSAFSRLSHGIDETLDEQAPPSEVWVERLFWGIWKYLAPDDQKQCTMIQPIIQSLPVMAHCIGRDNCIVAASKPWCDVLGYEPQEILGKKSVDLLSTASRDRALKVNLPLFWKQGHIEGVDYRFISKSGVAIDTSLSAVAEFDAQNAPLKSLAVISLKP